MRKGGAAGEKSDIRTDGRTHAQSSVFDEQVFNSTNSKLGQILSADSQLVKSPISGRMDELMQWLDRKPHVIGL